VSRLVPGNWFAGRQGKLTVIKRFYSLQLSSIQFKKTCWATINARLEKKGGSSERG